ncbi:S4 domain-containing protein YaaA [Aerococcaceae bacterium zg-ZJ1578]|uniref:S4 domain-containing protein YaaA n=1 Tax=Aerococcaceae TaxID=186827 RepID=UPI0013B85032|nr:MULTISPECIES: S4 domain-containing protein YaaA [unclassified Facklamia]MBK0348381.1 S4 domain-containing protein YaaA [Aerococcaceae bacterium zg-1578]MBR7927841.1 S4 domain-containing protein YaaA [Aerococcaceae bacterium zg-ZUI334]MBS4462644.1 S4 domain-containing protein YaaA [Aerococcaceae bacterium zg-B36]QQD65556.1 S4 domain-containing protein YaaA [Aerococcaceae bacterium zg-252]NEW64956.1 S4 domain-containing protein YaaA [Facklamia sp. 252]
MEQKTIEIHDQFITLGQLLKHESIISSGGMAKWYLSEHTVKLNNELEQRRGKKLYNGDVIELVAEQLTITVVQKD